MKCVRGCIALSVVHQIQEPEVPGLIPSQATYFCFFPSIDSRRAVVSYWQKYMHLELVNR